MKELKLPEGYTNVFGIGRSIGVIVDNNVLQIYDHDIDSWVFTPVELFW